MADNFSSRIERLRTRRRGINEIFAMDSGLESREILLNKSLQQETGKQGFREISYEICIRCHAGS
jgi:hypothetical protein